MATQRPASGPAAARAARTMHKTTATGEQDIRSPPGAVRAQCKERTVRVEPPKSARTGGELSKHRQWMSVAVTGTRQRVICYRACREWEPASREDLSRRL